MSKNATSASTGLEALSAEKRELLELLLKRRRDQGGAITAQPRDNKIAHRLTSWAQQRLWFIDQLEGAGALYNIPLAFRIRGNIEINPLRHALNTIVLRHEVLRTTFVNIAGVPYQEIRPEAEFQLEVLDLTDCDPQMIAEEVQRHREEEAHETFDLARGPLIRGRLLRLEVNEHILLITAHHIVFDGWSTGVLIHEMSELYSAFHRGGPMPLKPLPIQYADYALWQRESLQSEVRRQTSYWIQQLEAAEPDLSLPADRPRSAAQRHRGGTIDIRLGRQLTARLDQFARSRDMTRFMIVYAGWAALLARLSGQQDIVVGIPVASRPRPELEGLIGFFVNSLPLRVRVDGELLLETFLSSVKEVTIGAYGNQDVPFDHLVDVLNIPRSLNRHPLFQVMLALQNTTDRETKLAELDCEVENVPNDTAKLDLLLSLQERAGELVGSVSYDVDLFDRETVERWIECFHVLMSSLVSGRHERVADLEILSEDERRRLVQKNDATTVEYHKREKLIHELFEEQVERTPHELAVISQGSHLTYSQLNVRANQLARHLIKRGAAIDRFVGLHVARGIEMVVGLLGILKAGSAYVPLDPSYPTKRLEMMLKDSGAKLLVTQKSLTGGGLSANSTVYLDSEWSDIAQESGENLWTVLPATHNRTLAYVIFTSGSTGIPKGVAIEHRNATNLILWAQQVTSWDLFDQTLQATSLNFDLSVYECFAALTTGGCLRIVENALAALHDPMPVTLINTVPSAMKALAEAGSIPKSTRLVNLAGEPLKGDLVDQIFSTSEVNVVCNLYGPSETTTYSTWLSMTRDVGFTESIGRPIANTQIYILDTFGKLVPSGVTGEIYIGGAGVARGYFGRPGLTAERFLADPFSCDPCSRMYKTGDLGRWRKDGIIEYRGRNDYQVKIRGFRIELGEIEAQLSRQRQIKDVVVIVRENRAGERCLVAYIVPKHPSDQPPPDELRVFLRDRLPEYMVPSAFVTLERMPLTPNGKTDRRALPTPDLDAYASSLYEAPQTSEEGVLAQIWQDLLRIERVGRRDNFFELGGHSLLIVQMLEHLRRKGRRVELRQVFESPTLAELAAALEAASDANEIPSASIPPDASAISPEMLPLVRLEQEHIDQIARAVPGGSCNIQDIYPLAPLQEGILFHHLLNEDRGDVYVIGTALSVSSKARLNELIAALQRAVDQHDVLRTCVMWENLPRPIQVVQRRAAVPVIEEHWPAGCSVSEKLAEWMSTGRQRLELGVAPLLRLRVAAGERDHWYALLQLHHIIADGQSLRSLITEIVSHLEGCGGVAGDVIPYRHHVAHALARAREHDAEAFFRSQLGDIDEPTAPFGLLSVESDSIEQARIEFDDDLAKSIRAQAMRLRVSPATLFHSAWALVVAHTSGRDDVVFGTVLLGRMQSLSRARRGQGMFINTLPLRVPLFGVTGEQLVARVHRSLIELLGHEQASLAAAQRCSGISGAHPLFTALLNYRHMASTSDLGWNRASGVHEIARFARTNYPVTLSVDETADGFSITAQTDPRVRAEHVISYVQTAMQCLIDALQGVSGRPVLTLPILSDQLRLHILKRFNNTAGSFCTEKLVHQLFEEQARRTPDAIAVAHRGESLSYCQLNDKADKLAQYLVDRGVCAESLVGIAVYRSCEMVIGLLAILKAGGTYVPLDPSYPRDRLEYMLEDAGPKIVLSQADVKSVLPESKAHIIDLDESILGGSGDGDSAVPQRPVNASPRNLIYVIYTSGSTGKPKGTGMSHRSMMNLIDWQRVSLGSAEGQRVLQFAALSFDVAFQEILSTLCTGGTLVLLDEQTRRDARELLNLLERERVDRLFVPPMMLQALAEYHADIGACQLVLKDVITAGEQLRISQEIRRFIAACNCRLHNHYGPTETHVVTSLTLSGSVEDWPELPTIGSPIANTHIYILDRWGQLAPIGVVGEIFIGGDNVARGYIHRPDLTSLRFVADPFTVDARVMYRTGDLGRWKEDGTIEYVGRNDDQVKIRGYRIEVREIEARLEQHPQVKEAAVLVREDAAGEKRLIAYFVKRGPQEVEVEHLRLHLRALLPEHMIPSAFVRLDSMPLTPSGKLNRRALPGPTLDARVQDQYEPPHGATEEKIARIWAEVLQVSHIGRRDHFFEIGGHSLLVMKALLRLNQAFQTQLKVADFYRSPTLTQLSERIERGNIDDGLVDLAAEAVLPGDIVFKPGVRRVPPESILLTGGTGFIGRFLLAQLLRDSGATIHCLVRGPSKVVALGRLKASLKKWELWNQEYDERLVAVLGDLRQPKLGIDEITYDALASNVDSIYHCATSMNHLESYAMARPANVQSAKELLRFAIQAKPKVVNNISTLGVFRPDASREPRLIDEATPIDNERHPASQGYVASKWVAEKIFLNARDRGIACNTFRLGLVWADAQKGRFDELQNAYRVLKSSLLTGCGIKQYKYSMPPTPVDYVVRAIVYLAEKYPEGGGVFHISAPEQTTEGVFERCNRIISSPLSPLRLLPHYEWIQTMRRLHERGMSIPVVPLIEYAFHMDEETFLEQRRRSQPANSIRFDLHRTRSELENGGILTPSLDDQILARCVEGMLSRDAELRDVLAASDRRTFNIAPDALMRCGAFDG